MATTIPTRVDNDLFEAARSAGLRENRSAGQQLAYWASLGRELENSTDLTARDLARFVAGASYDELTTPGQVAARATIQRDIVAGIAGLDLKTEFAPRIRVSVAESDGTVHVDRRRGQ